MIRNAVRHVAFPLSPVPEFERSIFDWTLITLTVGTMIFGVLGWSFAQRASAAEVPTATAAQAQGSSGLASDLGGVVVPSCYFPENPAVCFNVGGGTPEPQPSPVPPLMKQPRTHARPSLSPMEPEPPVLPILTTPLS
ncbi:MAG: hypothetical protein D6742_05735 [Cyanobacteria bacterium J069]|nr:MAG: hypothetical protein D6742_05735 [Cyanobacteria bacterium J069]